MTPATLRLLLLLGEKAAKDEETAAYGPSALAAPLRAALTAVQEEVIAAAAGADSDT